MSMKIKINGGESTESINEEKDNACDSSPDERVRIDDQYNSRF